jgi:hypothetical protein
VYSASVRTEAKQHATQEGSVTKYRSVRDSGWFDIEFGKTILVGPNEAGKTVLLQALLQLNAPQDIPGFDVLRDHPRSEYNDVTTGKVDPRKFPFFFGLTNDEKSYFYVGGDS